MRIQRLIASFHIIRSGCRATANNQVLSLDTVQSYMQSINRHFQFSKLDCKLLGNLREKYLHTSRYRRQTAADSNENRSPIFNILMYQRWDHKRIQEFYHQQGQLGVLLGLQLLPRGTMHHLQSKFHYTALETSNFTLVETDQENEFQTSILNVCHFRYSVLWKKVSRQKQCHLTV